MTPNKGVHILLGTRKGAYVVDGDTKRSKWKVRGPFHAGGDVFMVSADPRSPGTIYAAVNNSFWGPMLHRSTDWGRKWKEASLPNMPRGTKRTMPEDGQAKYPVTNTWQIVAGREEEPKSLLLGIDPASLWRSNDNAESWEAVPGLNDHPSRSKWNPGAGGMCLHTILRDPTNPKRLYVAISAAGGFRSEDDGEHWDPINKGVVMSFNPDKRAEVGQCLHKLAMEPSNPSTIYRQDHDGIYVTHNRGERWEHVGQALPHDFGFVVATSATSPGGAYFVPLEPEGRTTWGGQLQMFRWEDKAKKFRSLMPKGAFPGAHGTHRDGLATDDLSPSGIYLGTTTGHLVYSPNAGKSWREVPYNFPGIHSVQVAGPAA